MSAQALGITFDVVVTRHAATIQLLRELGLVNDKTQVLSHVVDVGQIKGKACIGVLPVHMAAQAAIYATLDLLLPEEHRRENDLSYDIIKRYATALTVYTVKAVNAPKKHSLIVAGDSAMRELALELEPNCLVLPSANDADLAGHAVLGMLPLFLAAAASSYTAIELDIPQAARGKRFGVEELRGYYKGTTTYVVQKTTSIALQSM